MILTLCSRAIAAAGNLLSVALFARYVGPAEYGAYILLFAWAIVVYGFAAQWMKFAYFGVFRSNDEGRTIASFIRMLSVSLAVVAVLLAGLGALFALSWQFVGALFALFAGMAIYEAAVEISRTRLHIVTVSISMIARAVLVFALGAAALWIEPTATMLAYGVCAGHLLAAIPSLVMMRDLRAAKPSNETIAAIARYGWPLMFSFGVFAVGQSIDRFLISRDVGNEVLGPYGIVADMMRQSYMVIGESIAVALVTIAKRYANEGRRSESDQVMHAAFIACAMAAGFGAVFFIQFGPALFTLLLGAEFVAAIDGIIPVFAIGFGFMMMRSFYFAQVIYFSDKSHLELLIAVVFVVTSALLALVLVPRFGAVGGAVSLMVAQAAACGLSVFVGRRLYMLPVNVRALVMIGVLSAALVAAGTLLKEIVPSASLQLAAQASLMFVAVCFVVWRFKLIRALILVRPRGTDAE